jgi:hypothetical protein
METQESAMKSQVFFISRGIQVGGINGSSWIRPPEAAA